MCDPVASFGLPFTTKSIEQLTQAFGVGLEASISVYMTWQIVLGIVNAKFVQDFLCGKVNQQILTPRQTTPRELENTPLLSARNF